MRVLRGRGDWRPSVRIENLRRYAFIGDSNAYGSGVAPDETLPAYSERQMNELAPAWPIECVNLGVSGYNLWNSWLSFRYGPQVYDGVVLVLCHNDSDMFDFVFHVRYPSKHNDLQWHRSHFLGQAVERCFDEIAAFSRERSLPILVIYSNTHLAPTQMLISQVIGNLCASRGLYFIDTLLHYRERNFAVEDLVVSAANLHPSAKAHEAIGRHLAATVKGLGWFAKNEESSLPAVPGRICAAVKAMVESDRYPPEVAIDWALRALDAKQRVARRMQAEGSNDDFASAAAETTAALTTANQRWHMIQRTHAFVCDIAGTTPGIVPGLVSLDDEALKIEELCFALGEGDWNWMAPRLLEAQPPPPRSTNVLPSEAPAFFDECIQEVARFRGTLDELRSRATAASIGSPHDEGVMLADTAALEQIALRVETQCIALKPAFERLLNAVASARPRLSEEQIAHLTSLIAASFKSVKHAAGFVARLRAVLKRFQNTPGAPYTTLEVTMHGGAVAGSPLCILVCEARYHVPTRLPFSVPGWFRMNGERTLIKFYLPLLYAGRLTFNNMIPYSAQTAENIEKVEIYNGKDLHRNLDMTTFSKESGGRFVSPTIFLI